MGSFSHVYRRTVYCCESSYTSGTAFQSQHIEYWAENKCVVDLVAFTTLMCMVCEFCSLITVMKTTPTWLLSQGGKTHFTIKMFLCWCESPKQSALCQGSESVGNLYANIIMTQLLRGESERVWEYKQKKNISVLIFQLDKS